MELTLAVIAAGVVVVALLLYFRRPNHLRMVEDQLAEWRRSGKYWGVRVAANKGKTCDACRRLSGHVFPITSAPQLPLPACERGRCNCRYMPYPERRRGERRTTDRRSTVRFDRAKPERRAAKDRRDAVRVWKQERY